MYSLLSDCKLIFVGFKAVIKVLQYSNNLMHCTHTSKGKDKPNTLPDPAYFCNQVNVYDFTVTARFMHLFPIPPIHTL